MDRDLRVGERARSPYFRAYLASHPLSASVEDGAPGWHGSLLRNVVHTGKAHLDAGPHRGLQAKRDLATRKGIQRDPLT